MKNTLLYKLEVVFWKRLLSSSIPVDYKRIYKWERNNRTDLLVLAFLHGSFHERYDALRSLAKLRPKGLKEVFISALQSRFYAMSKIAMQTLKHYSLTADDEAILIVVMEYWANRSEEEKKFIKFELIEKKKSYYKKHFENRKKEHRRLAKSAGRGGFLMRY